ncbi:UNVERIFIED_CONTAM: hypothetical protein FKN15_018115 [Acipenser sinensis]
MAESLTAQEELTVEEFFTELKNREQPNVILVSQNTAVKFLMARKFDVSRAIDLFQAYKNTRLKEGIYNISPDEEPLRSELLSGKFTVLPGRDAKGAALALFTARLHRPDVTTHKAVLQAIIYQLDRAIESVETQRDGLIFIYDMTSSTYGNFDYELCVKILNLLKVCTVTAHELANHIPMESLPEHLGGSSQYSHVAWIQSCVNSTQGQQNGDCMDNLFQSYTLDQNPVSDGLNSNCTPQTVTDNTKHQHNHYHENRTSNLHADPSSLGNLQNLNSPVVTANYDGADTDSSVNTNGRKPPPQSETPPDTPLHKHGSEELAVPPLPQKARPLPSVMEMSIHLPEDGGMHIQELVQHIKRKKKKGIYQEYEEIRKEPPSGTFDYSKSFAKNIWGLLAYGMGTKGFNYCNDNKTGESRDVAHYLYMIWPDFGVPKSASGMLDFRSQVKQHQEAAFQAFGSEWTGPPGGPPIVVHCSAGIGRTGTFCTLDICLSRLEDIGTVDVNQTVKRMRTQRAFSIQTWDQYYFCYMAVLEYAQRRGLLAAVEWSDSDLETDKLGYIDA